MISILDGALPPTIIISYFCPNLDLLRMSEANENPIPHTVTVSYFCHNLDLLEMSEVNEVPIHNNKFPTLTAI